MFAFVLCSVLLASATAKISYFEVDGKCDDLKPQKDYSQEKYIAEPWRIVNASWTGDGDTCVSMVCTEGEGNELLAKITSFNTNTQKESSVDDKYVHRGDGSYIGPEGDSIENVVHTDYKNYLVCVECKTVEGKAQVLVTYSTRSGKIDDKAKAMFKQADQELTDLKMAAPMKEVPHEDCKY